MNDLILSFLHARLDTDYDMARAATRGLWRHNQDKHWHRPGTCDFAEAVFAGAPGQKAVLVAGTGPSDDPQSMNDARHIAHHHPLRVLREVAAKRRLVRLHDRITADGRPDGVFCQKCSGPDRYVPWPCLTLRTLAAVYADHPDYDPAWTSPGEAPCPDH